MAEQFDAMGNYLGDYETEEERKKREELANTAVHTQEIKTYGDGTQQRITKEEIPGAIAPKTVETAAGPVAPTDPVFQRQLQAESGNQQNNPRTGQIMTSPKGALGIAQIMPSTAMQPGYGVPDIFTLAEQRGIAVPDRSEATAKQLLGNQALNQEFGQNYKNAMLQKFNGDQAAATAAYNAGPGRVGQNMASNQGQLNVAGLPGETQGYLGKVMGGLGNIVNAVIPSAQAGTLSQPPANVGSSGFTPYDRNRPGNAAYQGAPVAPTPTPGAGAGPAIPGQAPSAVPTMTIDDNGNKTITNPDGTTTLLGPDNKPLAAGGMEPRDTPEFRNRLFQEAGKDPFSWMMIAKDPANAQFPNLQTVAKEQAKTLFQQEFQLNEAKATATKLAEDAGAGNGKAGRAIADELKKQEGSWVKMILLGFLSPQLAGEEAVKLGFGDHWQSVTDDNGKTALIKMNAKGMPLSGISADNKPLDESEVARFASGGVGKLKAHEMAAVHGVPVVNVNGEGGMRMYDPRTKTAYVQVGKERRPDIGWTTTSQAPGAVYNAAAAKTAGAGAGEGLTPGAVPSMPGVPGTGFGGQGNAGAGNAPAGNAPAGNAVAGAPVAGAPVAGNAGAPQVGIAQQRENLKIGTKQIEERNTANQKYSDELAVSRQTAMAQNATIGRLQTAIDKNPSFWGIDTNSPAWRAFVDVNSTNENKAESLNTLARNLNIPQTKRAEFDSVMNDYRALQVNAITGSGLTASQTNTERESQRVMGTVGNISDKPAAAKAALEYAKAKIEYTDTKAKDWAQARKTNPGIDRLDFESNFDATKGEKIFDTANKRMEKIIGSAGAGTGGGSSPEVGTVKDGWVFQGGNPADKNNWKKK